ncbi:hypothetical protein AYL99_01417 [Fonsecaea erecta]|uniref:Peptidase A1 domain-containing protein n=1 Tax=Fonsecaea erecta TaxID=1367422 RepID=A0A179A2T0_9EURO|nr:hypothetical protein AYL99_01417 [Fonsecaea erecta]OAP65445.1 hypothetical protein AYL99_01417 [Fonsecaea erecta]
MFGAPFLLALTTISSLAVFIGNVAAADFNDDELEDNVFAKRQNYTCSTEGLQDVCETNAADCVSAMCESCSGYVYIANCCALSSYNAMMQCLLELESNPVEITMTIASASSNTSTITAPASTATGMDACTGFEAIVLACEDNLPGFSTEAFSQQASCVCYSNGTYQPDLYDGMFSGCLAYLATASPLEYSSIVTGSVDSAPCKNVATTTQSSSSSSTHYIGRLTTSSLTADSTSITSSPTASTGPTQSVVVESNGGTRLGSNSLSTHTLLHNTMRTGTWAWAVAAILCSQCLAAPLSSPAKPERASLRLPVRKSLLTGGDIRRRSVSSPLKNGDFEYLIDLELGTPGQAITLSIDTGSSDIWVYGPGSCTSCTGGVFDPSKSSTGVYDSSVGDFSTSYFDGTSASGYYIEDTVGLGSATVTGVTFAVATSAASTQRGIMGIGLQGLEASQVKYPELLDDLQSQGLIDRRSYSIYLDDLEAGSGFILFGDVDSSKYSGDLVTLPIIPYTDSAPRLQVEWTSLSATDGSGSTEALLQSGFSYPVALDTGYTTSVLPVELFNELATYFNVYTDDAGNYLVPCQMPSGSFTFGFGDGPAVSIQVPYSELAVPEPSGSGACLFGFLPQDQSVISFGDTFLRSAYVYYDFDSSTISLAQAVWS